MSRLIAVTGKGGVGKTTVSAVVARQLIANGAGPVLAIDADPNACLDAALGVEAVRTVGGAREDVRTEGEAAAKSGVSKQELLRLKIAESLVESENFDLISMGRPEGAGCYCYANNVLKSVIAEISGEYPHVVLDNEAGLENLSRRIVSDVDVLAIVSDASASGLKTLSRLHALAVEMGVKYRDLVIIVNRLRGLPPDEIENIRKKTGASEVVLLGDDAEIAEAAESGRDVFCVPEENAFVKTINGWVKGYLAR